MALLSPEPSISRRPTSREPGSVLMVAELTTVLV